MQDRRHAAMQVIKHAEQLDEQVHDVGGIERLPRIDDLGERSSGHVLHDEKRR
jgi:hypothetical protein